MTENGNFPENLRRFLEFEFPMMTRKGEDSTQVLKPYRVIPEAMERIHVYEKFLDPNIREYAVEPLIKALKDKDEYVREGAAYALSKIEDARAVEPLIKALRDYDLNPSPEEDNTVFTKALVNLTEALGKSRDKRAVEPLIKALGDKKEFVRQSAAIVLGNIGDKRAVELLIKALGDKNGYVRGSAAIALGKIGDKRAVEPLIKALEDDATNAAEALGKIGDKRAVEPLIKALEDDELYKFASRKAAYIFCKVAAESLGKLGDEQAVKPLVRTFGKYHLGLTKASANAIIKIKKGNIKEEKDILKYIRSKKPAMIQRGASMLRTQEIIPENLHKFLKSSNIESIMNGVILANEAGIVEEVFDPMDIVMTDRLRATEALGKLDNLQAVKILIKLFTPREGFLFSLTWCPSPAMLDSAAKSLSGTKNVHAIKPLIECLKHRNSQLQNAASKGLVNIGEASIKPLIENGYTDLSLSAFGKLAVKPLIEVWDSSKSAQQLPNCKDCGLECQIYQGLCGECHTKDSLQQRKDFIDSCMEFMIVSYDGVNYILETKTNIIYLPIEREWEKLLSSKEDRMRLGNSLKSEDKIGEWQNGKLKHYCDCCGLIIDTYTKLKDKGETDDVASWLIPDYDRGHYLSQWIGCWDLPLSYDLQHSENCNFIYGNCDCQMSDPPTYLLYRRKRYTNIGVEHKYDGYDIMLPFCKKCYNGFAQLKKNISFISALELIGSERAIDGIIKALKDEHFIIRISSVEALARIGEERAIDGIIKALDDKHLQVRISSVQALVPLINEKTIEPLIKALKGKNSNFRYHAAKALEKIGDKRAVEPLIKALEDEDVFVRKIAAIALGNIGDKRAVEPLIKALEDKNENVREGAIEALGDICDKRAVEPLLGVLSSDNFDDCRSAAMALGKLGWTPETDELKFVYLDSLVRHRQSIEWRKIEPIIKTLADEWGVSAKELIKKIRRTITEKYTRSHNQLLFLEEKILNLEQKEFEEIIEKYFKTVSLREALDRGDFVSSCPLPSHFTAEKLIELLSGSSPQARWLVTRAIVEIPIDIFWSEISNYPILITKAERDEIVRIMKILPQTITIRVGTNVNNFAMKVSKQKDASAVMKKNGKMMISIFADPKLAKIILGGMS